MKNVHELLTCYLRECEKLIFDDHDYENKFGKMRKLNSTQITFLHERKNIKVRRKNRSTIEFNYRSNNAGYKFFLKIVTDFIGRDDLNTEGILSVAQEATRAQFSVSIPQSWFNYVLENYIMTENDPPEFAFSVQSSPAKFSNVDSEFRNKK